MSQGKLSRAKKHTPSAMSKSEDQPKISYFKSKNALVIQNSSTCWILLRIPLTAVLPETLKLQSPA